MTDVTLAQLVDAQLSSVQVEQVHQHIDQCDPCRMLVAELIKAMRPVATGPAASPPPEVAADAVGEVTQDMLPSSGSARPPGLSPELRAMSRYAPGQRIGPYEVVRILGAGGMGAVLEGVHTAIGHRVAIKMLHPWLSSEPEFRTRIFNEARAVNLVQHPGLVSIFEFGELPGGDIYLVMEYLEGQSWRKKWPVPPSARVATLALLRQVATAMQVAHDKGIVHREQFVPSGKSA